jgi:predicted heme/steroid binding protein
MLFGYIFSAKTKLFFGKLYNMKMIKLDRIAAWTLFICIIMYFISGYGITKGIINAGLAITLHNKVLTYIMLVSFVIHSAFAIRLAFLRWKIWNSFGKYLWGVFYTCLILGFVYVASFYSKSGNKPTQANSVTTSSIPTVSSSIKMFTLDELSRYNGKNGERAYVAVDGSVYDLTSVFQNGTHFSHYAGTELTNAFYSRHAKSALAKYPIVGQLIK